MIFKAKVNYLILGFLFFTIPLIFGQDQKIADSLAIIYKENQLTGTAKLELLEALAFNEMRDSQLALQYAEESIALSTLKEGNEKYLISAYITMGSILRKQGKLEGALTILLKAAEIAVITQSISQENSINITIADIYAGMGNYGNAELYYDKAIHLLRKNINSAEDPANSIRDSIKLGSALLNQGDTYFNNKKYDAALRNFEEAGPIFKKTKFLQGTAYNVGNIGMVYAEQGKDSLAEANMNQAIQILEDVQDYYPISVYLTYISDIYFRKNNWKTAVGYAQKSLDLAKKYNLREQISAAYLKLSNLEEHAGNFKAANSNYKNHILYRDSIQNLDVIQKMADLRTNYEVAQNQKQMDIEVAQKQIEVDLLNQQKRSQKIINFVTIVALLMACIVAFGLFRRNKYIHKTNKIIEAEKNRSDQLLLNILPADTAEELKRNGKVRAKKFKATTVLFTDFEGFTHYAEHLSPEKLVESVDYYFSKFDEIIEKYGIEKIKTVGDAYMCAVGLHGQKENEAINIILAAIEMIDFVEKSKKNNTDNLTRFDIRIGLNSGPVVAGVVGTKKFAYDIWGDTVNIASRMESNSQIGKINVTENTYKLIKNTFDCHYRGEIDVKNKGMMKMYFVDQLKTNITPNQLFSCN